MKTAQYTGIIFMQMEKSPLHFFFACQTVDQDYCRKQNYVTKSHFY